MKAIEYNNYGLPQDVLKLVKLEKPIPKKDELLVRVKAATVNRTDCAMLTAKPFIMRFFCGLTKPKKKVLGTDFAGVIEAVGSSIKNYKIGDKIFGFHDMGVQSYAQYLTIKASKPLSLMPDGLEFKQATASLEGAHYAYNFLNKAKIKDDHRILVNGATGAIGSAMVQLLTTQNVHITAVANTKNLDLVSSLGADRVIDYLNEDFTNLDKQFDFIFDAVGKSTFSKCKPLLQPKGVYISSEVGPSGQNIFYALSTPLSGGKKVVFPLPTDIQKSIDYIKSLLEAGQFNAVIDRVYPLEQVADAFAYVLQGSKTGNVVIAIN